VVRAVTVHLVAPAVRVATAQAEQTAVVEMAAQVRRARTVELVAQRPTPLPVAPEAPAEVLQLRVRGE
jgi:hypothetical protein